MTDILKDEEGRCRNFLFEQLDSKPKQFCGLPVVIDPNLKTNELIIKNDTYHMTLGTYRKMHEPRKEGD